MQEVVSDMMAVMAVMVVVVVVVVVVGFRMDALCCTCLRRTTTRNNQSMRFLRGSFLEADKMIVCIW